MGRVEIDRRKSVCPWSKNIRLQMQKEKKKGKIDIKM